MYMDNKFTKKLFPGVGARVRRLRNLRGLSQQVTATRGPTTPQTLIQLECHDLATTRTLNCVARALGTTVDDLLGRGRRDQ